MQHRLAAALLVAPLAVAAAGCSRGGDSSRVAALEAKVSELEAKLATTTTVPDLPTAPDAEGSSTSGRAGASTTAASKAGAVVLGGSSFGVGKVGDPVDATVAKLTTALGKPGTDQKNPAAACPGPDRWVKWGRFSVLSTNGKVTGWQLDEGTTPALATPSGVTTGTTVAKLKQVYGAKLKLTPGDENNLNVSSFTASLSTGEALKGYLSSTEDAGKVTALFGGIPCGE